MFRNLHTVLSSGQNLNFSNNQYTFIISNTYVLDQRRFIKNVQQLLKVQLFHNKTIECRVQNNRKAVIQNLKTFEKRKHRTVQSPNQHYLIINNDYHLELIRRQKLSYKKQKLYKTFNNKKYQLPLLFKKIWCLQYRVYARSSTSLENVCKYVKTCFQFTFCK